MSVDHPKGSTPVLDLPEHIGGGLWVKRVRRPFRFLRHQFIWLGDGDVVVEGGLKQRHKGLKAEDKSWFLLEGAAVWPLSSSTASFPHRTIYQYHLLTFLPWHCLYLSPHHPITAAHLQCSYLQEERTLALSLRAGGPEPVRKSVCWCRGDVVAQSQRLLFQLLWWTVSGQQTLPLSLQAGEHHEWIKNMTHDPKKLS